MRPIKWEIQGGDIHQRVYVEEREQRDGTRLYVVVNSMGSVLAKDGEFEWEPQPSSRADEFIARTRFASPFEAHTAYASASSSHSDSPWTDEDLREFAHRLAYRGCDRPACGACQRRLGFALGTLEQFIEERRSISGDTPK